MSPFSWATTAAFSLQHTRLSFDGVDDLLSLETVITTGKPENVTLTTPMTIEMWLKPDADASFPEVVFESSTAIGGGVEVGITHRDERKCGRRRGALRSARVRRRCPIFASCGRGRGGRHRRLDRRG